MSPCRKRSMPVKLEPPGVPAIAMSPPATSENVRGRAAPPSALPSARDVTASRSRRSAARRVNGATVAGELPGPLLQGDCDGCRCRPPTRVVRCRPVTSTSLVAGPCRSHTGSYRSRRWSTSLLLLAAVALAAAVPALGTGPIDEKKAEARQVYAEIISLDQSLGVADE